MNKRIFAAVIGIGALVIACGGPGESPSSPGGSSASPQEQEGSWSSSSITGVVKDSKTLAAVAGVTISDGNKTATTGTDGSYRLAETSGTYTLTATKTGYATATQQAYVPRRSTVTSNFSLTALVCTYTYSAWGTCTNGTQTRTVTSTTPTGCQGTPILQQACSTGTTTTPSGSFKVFANNDLGMHCVDSSFAVFSILPPYNVVDAQVVELQSTGDPIVLDQTKVVVRYSPIADATGSINSTDAGKTDFYSFAAQLYGASLQLGQGLQGMWMPANAPNPAATTLVWDTTMGLFKAPGIPIFPVDDAGKVNRYPLMRFSAYDTSGSLLASTDVVLPVSEETSCQNCHATGKVAAPSGAQPWSNDGDLEKQARQNILILHNARNPGAVLTAPVLCASCHYSPALDLAGAGPSAQQTGHATMSSAMHGYHADRIAALGVDTLLGLTDAPVPVGGTVPAATSQTCYQCHPGATTQCLRGAMTAEVDCQNCHGNMAAVGGQYPLLTGGSIDGTNDGKPRRPWLDLPRCQSCHANDAVTKTVLTNPPPLEPDGLRFSTAYQTGDASASPILATNQRFAEEPDKLYRKSKGHGGLACEACHGSTHAIWSGNANDNVAATELQGHAGLIGECSTCHLTAPANGLGGPHGMHPVGSAWVSGHQSQAESNRAACQPCHGADYRGTVLSRMLATRTLAGKTLTAGTVISCYTCHNGPNP